MIDDHQHPTFLDVLECSKFINQNSDQEVN